MAATKPKLPPISRVAFLTIAPRDVVVIESPAVLTPEQCDQIKRFLKVVWPKNRSLVLTGGMTLKIGTDQTEGNGNGHPSSLPPDIEDEMAHPATLRLLIKAGADIELADVTGWTRDQRERARTWALQELDIQKQGGPPARWPAHVKRAHRRRMPRRRT